MKRLWGTGAGCVSRWGPQAGSAGPRWEVRHPGQPLLKTYYSFIGAIRSSSSSTFSSSAAFGLGLILGGRLLGLAGLVHVVLSRA